LDSNASKMVLKMASKIVSKIKKEARMKKVIIVMLALFLAVPAITYAGSVTSKYDVTLGGYVKFDLGWSNQNNGPDYLTASRESLTNNKNRIDEYGNTYMYSGETRMNMLVKGPDAWGAKTGAFIEGDFRASASANNQAGVMTLRHAYMKFDWAQDSLIIGQTWNEWGMIFSVPTLAFNEMVDTNKGFRQPQIRWTHKFNKNFSFFAGIYSQYNTLSNTTTAAAQNDAARSLMPHFMGEVTWKTDSCGKIGPWMTQFSFGGFYGQEKYTYKGTNNTWSDEKVNTWMMALKGYVPIIPEKKGNKGGAFAITGAAFYGQISSNSAEMSPLGFTTTTGVAGTGLAMVPKTYGGWGGLTYYFTDALYLTGIYTTRTNNFNYSNTLATANRVRNNQAYIANLVWDVNPAVRFGLEYSRVVTGYGHFGTSPAGTAAAPNPDFTANAAATGSGGKSDNIRIGAWYFF